MQALGLPLCSLEVEYGPSQCEITFNPGIGLEAADIVVLARSAIRQIARRHGYHATFMCRPKIANVVSSGWHLHQSLRSITDGGSAFLTDEPGEILSPLGRGYLAGLLAHAPGAAAFSTPTINGYRRYRAYSNAPDRAIWGRDNRGVMLRVVGEPGSLATRIENRIGEPAANPYLYMSSQIITGLDGIDRGLLPPPSADTPYETQAVALPTSLDQALGGTRRRCLPAHRLQRCVRRLLAAYKTRRTRPLHSRRGHRVGAAGIFLDILRTRSHPRAIKPRKKHIRVSSSG